MSAEKRDSVVGISRNLTDALMAQIDSGVIIPTEESALQWNSMLDYAPNRNDISDMREDVWIGIGEFQKLAERFKMPTHNAVAFFEKEPLLMENDPCLFVRVIHWSRSISQQRVARSFVKLHGETTLY